MSLNIENWKVAMYLAVIHQYHVMHILVSWWKRKKKLYIDI